MLLIVTNVREILFRKTISLKTKYVLPTRHSYAYIHLTSLNIWFLNASNLFMKDRRIYESCWG